MALRIAIVDGGPLFAAADMDAVDHAAALAALCHPQLHLVIPALVVAEVTQLIGSRLGPAAEAWFLSGLAAMDVEAPASTDWPRIAELVERHSALPLGGTGASVVALAERLGTATVITLDRRQFRTIRPRHCNSLIFLP